MKKIFVLLAILIALFSFSFRLVVNASKPSDFGLKEGDLISAIFSDDPDVYIINEHGYKRLFLNPEIFKFYSHLGGFTNVKLVTQEVRDSFPTSGLFRNCEDNDQKVFGIDVEGEDTGQLHWVNTTGDQAVQNDPDFFKKVFCINKKEFSWYKKASEFTSVTEVPKYDRIMEAATVSTQERLGAQAETKNIGKVIICHYPSENISAYNTLTIDASALKAHLDHGDTIGACLLPTLIPSPSASPGPTALPSATPTMTASPSPTASQSFSPTPTATTTATPVPTTTTTPSASSTPTPTPTPTPTSSQLIFSNKGVTNITPNSVTIVFTTNVPVAARVLGNGISTYEAPWEPPNTGGPPFTYISGAHSIPVSGLLSGTTYMFELWVQWYQNGILVPDGYSGTFTTSVSTPTPTPTPIPTTPQPPSSVTISLLNSTTYYDVEVKWTASAIKYKIYRSTNGGEYQLLWSFFPANNLNVTATYYDDAWVSPNTTYRYKIYGCNNDSGVTCSLMGTESNSITTRTAPTPTPTPTPATSSVSYDNFSKDYSYTFDRDLYFGVKGNDVKQLQALLVNEVSYSANLITGYFGNITRDAVKRLQEKYKIRPVSGYFGEITRKALTALISN